MMRSLRASVSPCFILMRFLSKHFMAYLGGGHTESLQPPCPQSRASTQLLPTAVMSLPAPGACSQDNIPATP